jgi:hypothetical protein
LGGKRFVVESIRFLHGEQDAFAHADGSAARGILLERT